jgi:hypothetical protein
MDALTNDFMTVSEAFFKMGFILGIIVGTAFYPLISWLFGKTVAGVDWLLMRFQWRRDAQARFIRWVRGERRKQLSTLRSSKTGKLA